MRNKLLDSSMPLIVFIISIITLGSLYISNVGAKTLGDNAMHLYNTYTVATGQLHREFKKSYFENNVKEMVFHGHENYITLDGGDLDYASRVISPFEKDSNIVKQKDAEQHTSTKLVEGLSRTQYSPVNWAAPAIGLRIGLSMHLEPYSSWQLARISNLIVYSIIFVVAIIIMPKAKWIIVATGIFPLSVFLASSVAGDAINIAFSALFIAVVMHYIFAANGSNRVINFKEKILFACLILLMFNLKIAYVPEIIILFLIPNNFFNLINKLRVIVTSSLIGVLSSVLWSKLFGTVLLGFTDLSANMHVVKAHFVQAVFSVLAFTWNIPLLMLRGLGHDNASSTIESTLMIFVILLIVLSITMNYSYYSAMNHESFAIKIRSYFPILMFVFACLGSLFLTNFALLTTWTKLYEGGIGQTFDMTNIQGFQARYLLPLIPLISLFFVRVEGKEKIC